MSISIDFGQFALEMYRSPKSPKNP